jgi:hypothetical protein
VQTLFLNELTGAGRRGAARSNLLEQDGTTTNFHGKVQTLKQVFKPRERRDERGNTLSACAPDWIIFTKLLQLLGKDPGFTTASQWSQKFRALPQASNAVGKFTPVAYEASPAVLPEDSLRLLTGPLSVGWWRKFPLPRSLEARCADALYRNQSRRRTPLRH